MSPLSPNEPTKGPAQDFAEYNYFDDYRVGDQYAPLIDVNNRCCRSIIFFVILILILFSIILLISTINVVVL